MTITFETAALADLMARANRVAPNKGAAFDKAAGIILAYDKAKDEVTVKATDLDVTFLEKIHAHECDEQTDVLWRIPSALIAGIMSGMPLGTMTELSEEDGLLHIKCGKAKAKIRMHLGAPFVVEEFDPNGLVEVSGFATRVGQVAWACDRSAIPFTGVHIDGKRLVATDRYRVATVPLVVPVTEPITVPLDVLTSVSKNVADVSIAAVDKRLHLMPSDHTQITAVIYDALYPAVDKIMWRADDKDSTGTPHYDQSCTFDKDILRDSINRMLVLCKTERYPRLKLVVGQKRIHITINVPDVGVMEDEVSVSGADHPDFHIEFTPLNFIDGFFHSIKNQVTMHYQTSNAVKNVLFEDGDGYECWVVPRHPASGDTEDE